MGTKLIFLADAHLCPERPERADSLCAFLRAQRAETQAVYIIGDLFDYWTGAKQRRLPEWAGILERLGDAARGGPPVGVVGGNRDYMLDHATLAPYGLTSLGMDHRFERDGLRFHLIHGHMQFPDPWTSRLFLRWIQGRTMRAVAGAAPLWACRAVAGMIRFWRRLAVRGKDPKDAQRYDPAAFLPFFDAGANIVVCGHNHFAHDYSAELARPGCHLFALGPWAFAPSHLEYADGAFRLLDPRL